jgi:hypothetical protein
MVGCGTSVWACGRVVGGPSAAGARNPRRDVARLKSQSASPQQDHCEVVMHDAVEVALFRDRVARHVAA